MVTIIVGALQGQKLTEVCGSKRFQAPEVMRRATCRKAPGYEAPPVDVWSMAVILFELVHGQIRLSQSVSIHRPAPLTVPGRPSRAQV